MKTLFKTQKNIVMQKLVEKNAATAPQKNRKVLYHVSKLPVQKIQLGQIVKIDIVNGWGACSVNGCYCQSYMGNADTCQNCGHNYSLHW